MIAIEVNFSKVKSFSFQGKDLKLRMKDGSERTVSFDSRKEMMDAARAWVNESLRSPAASPELEAIRACRHELSRAGSKDDFTQVLRGV